jgi:transposase InsO family protein
LIGASSCRATVIVEQPAEPLASANAAEISWGNTPDQLIGQTLVIPLSVVAADFFLVPTATCRLLFVLVILAHQRRRVVHVAVTAHPTAAWTAQQLREAFPRDEVPRYLIHDRDHAFAGIGLTAIGMGIHDVLTAPRSPWQNAYAERLIGSIRREYLDHVIVVNEAGLSRLLTRYLTYYHQSRTHLSLDRDSPQPRAIASPTCGQVVVSPQVGGLHHRYDRRAA